MVHALVTWVIPANVAQPVQIMSSYGIIVTAVHQASCSCSTFLLHPHTYLVSALCSDVPLSERNSRRHLTWPPVFAKPLMLMLVVVVCGLPTCRHCLHRQLVNQPRVIVHFQCFQGTKQFVTVCLVRARRNRQAFVENSRRFCSSRVSADSITSV